MRRVALVPLAALAGCLYTGGLNKPPTLQLVEPTVSSTFKGGTLSVFVNVGDDTDLPADLLANMKLTVASTNIEDGMLGPCDYTLSRIGNRIDAQFFRTGGFTIQAVTNDHLNAPSGSSTVTVTISDAPPTFTASSMPMPTSARNACDLYVAGDTVTLGFSGTVNDADQIASASSVCNTDETFAFTWRITGMPGNARPQLTRFMAGACLPPTAASGTTLFVGHDPTAQVCLWTDASMPSSTAMYTVVLDVSDGTTTVTSPVADVPVSPDQPPCITGTQPVIGSYVVDRTQTQHFEVEGVFDDRDPFGSANLTYAWSVWRTSDATWRPVLQRQQSTYDLDTSGFLVGEHVKVRVEAIDRTGPRPGCDVGTDDCIVTSCQPGGVACHMWKTWDLELR